MTQSILCVYDLLQESKDKTTAENSYEESDENDQEESHSLQSATARGGGKYKWDKKHCCKFCNKMVLKMSKHLGKVHSNIPEVAKVLAMTKGTKALGVGC